MGTRFAQYVVVDGEFATAPFLPTAGELGLRVARLKDNLPELLAAAQQRFPCGPPTTVSQQGPDRLQLWDAEDFDPLGTERLYRLRYLHRGKHRVHSSMQLLLLLWLSLSRPLATNSS